MSFIDKIPRGLRVLLTMAILAILIWRLAAGTEFYYYSIGAAVLLTAAVTFAVYWHPAGTGKGSTKNKSKKRASKNPAGELPGTDDDSVSSGESSATIPIETDYTDGPAIQRGAPTALFQKDELKPGAIDVASKYLHMSKMRTRESRALDTPQTELTDKVSATEAEEAPAEPPMPLIEDESTLTEEEKNELVNAVWYRCENPYCKYTHFLSVHHLLDEKEGGTNKLANLIVLCPYCHDLAHRGEVPEDQMRDWISNREERFKFKPDWHYF